MTPAGIYFLDDAGDPGFAVVFFYDLSDRRLRQTATFPYARNIRPLIQTIAVSRDGEWLVYSQQDQVNSDLVLVENFR